VHSTGETSWTQSLSITFFIFMYLVLTHAEGAIFLISVQHGTLLSVNYNF
jgi:hypothetical protein